jgi:hypothetical protein
MAFPEGHYTGVRVVDILTGGTLLTHGTGTSSAIGVFSCGEFAVGDRPAIGDVPHYNITATRDGGAVHGPSPFKCVHSGPTSDFRS